jgi:hypothetical protein
LGDRRNVIESVHGVRCDQIPRVDRPVDRLDGLGVNVVVEILTLVDGVDRVDSLDVQFVGEGVDVASDDGEMKLAADGVREVTTRRDDLVADVPERPLTMFCDREDVITHAALTPISRSKSASSPAVSSALPSNKRASPSLSGTYMSVIDTGESSASADNPRSSRPETAISLLCAWRMPRRLAYRKAGARPVFERGSDSTPGRSSDWATAGT